LVIFSYYISSTRFFRMRDTPTTLTASFNDLLYVVCDCSAAERQAMELEEVENACRKGCGIEVLKSDGAVDANAEEGGGGVGAVGGAGGLGEALNLLLQMDALSKQHIISGMYHYNRHNYTELY
jgi:hypothetical protein